MEFDGNVMVYGPPMSGKTILARNLMLKEIKRGFEGVYVTTNDVGEDVEEWFKEFDVSIKIIDCISKTIQPDCKNTENIVRCSSPIDLSGVSANLGKILGESQRRNKRNVIVFDSISSFLMYTNLQTVYRFLHFTTKRIKLSKSKALHIVQEGMHDERTIATLKQIFDGVIEVKANDKNFMRFMSSTQKTDWIEFTIREKEVIF